MPSPTPRRGPTVDLEPPPALQAAAGNHQLLFKKHKVLPHPRKDASYAGLRGPRPMASSAATMSAVNGALSDVDAHHLGSHAAKRHKELGNGPDLPPTPPAHSRNSSSSYSILPSNATCVQSLERSSENVQIKPPPPITPTKQMSPPTPDVTPPSIVGPESRPKGLAMRTVVRERGFSKGTNDSQSESFETAPENPSSEEEDDSDGRSTLRHNVPSSVRTSESTVRRIVVATEVDDAVMAGMTANETAPTGAAQNATMTKTRQPLAVGLGLGLESSPEGSLTLQTKRDFVSFDGEWVATVNDEVVQEWDGNLDRNVVVARKCRGPRQNVIVSHRDEVIKDTTALPTKAALAVRSMSLPQRILTFPPPKENGEQPRRSTKEEQPLASAATITAQMPSSSSENRRVSTISSKSTASTVIEAYLVDAPLQRRKTLRHVKKQVALRDSVSDLSPTSSAPPSLLDDGGKQQQQQRRRNGAQHDVRRQDSILSTSTVPSVSSRSARREILKAGGIPVIVVPDRRSSTKSTSREPSLRSTSSRRSKRSQSVCSVPLSQISGSRGREPSGISRRGRAYSDSDGSAPGDQRTLDYPPIVPRRTSSLSAPTSRNASRSGSLTSESVKAHAELLQSKLKAREAELPSVLSRLSREDASAKTSDDSVFETKEPRKAMNRGPVRETARVLIPKVNLATVPALKTDTHERENGYDGHHDFRAQFDPNMHLSPQNTPFSFASVDTATSHHSHAELSEAMAVSIFAHQNTSILMVDHSTRPSECSSETQPDRATDSSSSSRSKDEVSSAPSVGSSGRSGRLGRTSLRPDIKTPRRSLVADDGLATPHPIFSMDDVDSPLRNPRAPPAPPAINFIPATPSGLTPAPDKKAQMGNFFADEFEDRPKNNVSTVLRRVLSRGRRAEYGPSASRTTGLIGRTLSLTRSSRRGGSGHRRSGSVSRRRGVGPDSEPADEGKLHPFWRPMSFYMGDDGDFVRDDDDEDDDDEYYRYPPIDNRPHEPRRSLSSRMKRTFAILPLDDMYDSYPATSDEWPDRRTVRRTPSGNLRVVRHRASDDAAGQTGMREAERPQTAPRQQVGFWRTPSFLKRRTTDPQRDATGDSASNRHTTFPFISDKAGERGLQSIPRRISERRREKRSNELRQKISGPQEVRDGVGEVIRRSNYRDAFTQAQMNS
ncbi:hypothetical protein CMQ_1114 [Grosmannia clavigera kw1407]|uniref:Uncharacterized protein n=1 Tax=Grosmannia clavigera (strain kw1407 / UAMH 11150) TaxID=655863 RepID=F0XE84_GROCL|nr:uncharacterized protein CMQ_1114 [Grosmannia clavigera kw1407]EFX04186.1 hypothetical protein CMQ_1114 [Grosmannia clavigera kw1407]